jgi:hypothetical protein
VGGTTFRALIISPKPVEYGALGIYSKALLSGTMAAGLAAGSTVYSWRWGTAGGQLGVVLRSVLDGLAGSATAFTAGFFSYRVFQARTFTASDTGGTAGTLTGSNSKLRTSMGTTLLTDVRIASTAALGAGTRTLDTDAVAQISGTIGVVVSVQYLAQVQLFGEAVESGGMPIVCAQNEGFIHQATVPATGTWQFGVTTKWAEVTSY